MSFLTWNNPPEAQLSLDAINAEYGCPYEADNGYRMDQWDNTEDSQNGLQAGFYKPEKRLGVEISTLMAAIDRIGTDYSETPERPPEFDPPDDQADLISEG